MLITLHTGAYMSIAIMNLRLLNVYKTSNNIHLMEACQHAIHGFEYYCYPKEQIEEDIENPLASKGHDGILVVHGC
jgi:hypothetical protein